MNWYDNNRSIFRTVFKFLTLLFLLGITIFLLKYAFTPVPAMMNDTTTIYGAIPFYAVPISFFLVFRQLKTKRRDYYYIIDWIEMLLSLIVLSLFLFYRIYFNVVRDTAAHELQNAFRISVGCLAVLLTQTLLIYLFRPNSKPKATTENNNPKE